MAKLFLFFSILTLLFAPAYSFLHPGLLVTDDDITRIKSKLALGLDPWQSSWDDLTSREYANVSYTNHAVSGFYRSTDGDNEANGILLWGDIAAALSLTLRWKIEGNNSYADAAADILVAWASTLEVIGGDGDDRYLGAGLQGHELANIAELLRDYQPFASNGFQAVSDMLTNIFLPMNLDFLNHMEGSEHNVKHFFANWELCNLASAMAIAVLTDNQTVWDFGLEYFKTGTGNGNIHNAITNLVEEPGTGVLLGQGQEEGRDQGHSALDFQLLGVVAQQAWNQGEDLYSYNDSRLLKGAEYFARYNLGHEVPFENYTNSIVYYSEVSNASRGTVRPAWELLHSHYVVLKDVDAPWTVEYLNYTLDTYGGYELGVGALGDTSGGYDSLGWGSLLYHRDASEIANSTSSNITSTTTSSYFSTNSSSISSTLKVSSSSSSGMTLTSVVSLTSTSSFPSLSTKAPAPSLTHTYISATVTPLSTSSVSGCKRKRNI